MEQILAGIAIGFACALAIIGVYFKYKGKEPCCKEQDMETPDSWTPTEDWEPGTETVMFDGKEATMTVSANTQIVCKCGGKSYLRDKKCVRCDHHFI